MESMASMLAQECTDVEVPLCPQRDARTATSCFRCVVMIAYVVTVLSHGSAVVSLT